MVGILGSTTIISEYREFRCRQARKKSFNNDTKESSMNETTHLLTAPTKEALNDESFEEDFLSLYDCPIQTYRESNCYQTIICIDNED